jgi:hypothetical protein
MKRQWTHALVLVAALGMLGACGDDDDAQFPTGKFIPVDATSTDGGYIEYRSDGTYIGIDDVGDTFSQGTYTVDGDEITFVSDSFCEAAAPGSSPITYTYDWDGEVMSFADNPDDTCAARVETLAIDGQLATD